MLTPIKAIRAYCIGCMCGNMAEVKRCTIPSCPLYPYRLGHRPKLAAEVAVGAAEDETEDKGSID